MRTFAGSNEEFLLAHVAYAGDDCVVWPFALHQKGYGITNIGGRQKLASRWMCIMAHGEPPTPKHEAAHSCGNRPCVNPKHIRWATSKENRADMNVQGTLPRGENCGGAVLSENEVRSIRADSRIRRVIAAAHGISIRQVFLIRSGRSWSHLK